MLRAVDCVRDALGKGVDPGIRETVAVLNLLGFRTRQSCEGHVNEQGFGLPSPWVDIDLSIQENMVPESMIKLLLADFQRSRKSPGDARLRWEDGRIQSGDCHDGLERVRRRIETGTLAGDDLRRLRATLASRQREMRDFTEFLKNRLRERRRRSGG
ncbi:hypothetical protein [Skermanella pratensis]|uniref:hypothetical protein n=1 Tax=Skermanella pratensis TaxID=2233999 RepID=UPI00130181F2|nr:hypothetical protein [Skermanella pratensis]